MDGAAQAVTTMMSHLDEYGWKPSDFSHSRDASDCGIFAKNAFKNLLTKQLTPDANGNINSDIFNTIWANTTLRGNLFGTRNRDDAEDYFAQTLISNAGSTFYNFIKVK